MSLNFQQVHITGDMRDMKSNTIVDNEMFSVEDKNSRIDISSSDKIFNGCKDYKSSPSETKKENDKGNFIGHSTYLFNNPNHCFQIEGKEIEAKNCEQKEPDDYNNNNIKLNSEQKHERSFFLESDDKYDGKKEKILGKRKSLESSLDNSQETLLKEITTEKHLKAAGNKSLNDNEVISKENVCSRKLTRAEIEVLQEYQDAREMKSNILGRYHCAGCGVLHPFSAHSESLSSADLLNLKSSFSMTNTNGIKNKTKNNFNLDSTSVSPNFIPNCENLNTSTMVENLLDPVFFLTEPPLPKKFVDEKTLNKSNYLYHMNNGGIRLAVARISPFVPKLRKVKPSEIHRYVPFRNRKSDCFHLSFFNQAGDYQVDFLIFKRIMKKIENVNAQYPVFYVNQCYSWKPAKYGAFEKEYRMMIKGKNQSISRIIAAHSHGLPDDSEYLSYGCYCGAKYKNSEKFKQYQYCCRPVVTRICGQLNGKKEELYCVNPLHMKIIRSAEYNEFDAKNVITYCEAPQHKPNPLIPTSSSDIHLPMEWRWMHWMINNIENENDTEKQLYYSRLRMFMKQNATRWRGFIDPTIGKK